MTGDGDGSPNWRLFFARLDALPPGSGNASKQRRGIDFEQVLKAMFEEAGMCPRSRFRPVGEEIDGSFIYRGRPMLFEAKWTADPVPASVLYQFRGKLDGKLTGTLGLFISMAGYAEDAVDALVAGKSLNLILFDGDDIRKIAYSHDINIQTAIDLKLRAAVEEGTPFLPLPDPATPGLPALLAPVVIVEGNYDAEIIRALIRIQGTQSSLTIVPAGGRLNLPLVALAQLSLLPGTKNVIIVVDGDGKATEIKQQIEQALSAAVVPLDVNLTIIAIEPNLETALNLAGESVRRRLPSNMLLEILQALDLDKLAAANVDLAQLLRWLGLID